LFRPFGSLLFIEILSPKNICGKETLPFASKTRIDALATNRNPTRPAPVPSKEFLNQPPKEEIVSKKTMTAAFALMLAAALPAYAQTSSTSPSSTSPSSTSPSSMSNSHVTATQLQPGQMRATQLDGATVYDTRNQKVGDVKDIILDRDGKVAAVVIDVGAFLGIGGKNVAVSMNDLKITQDSNSNRPRVAVDMTKDQLKAAQVFDLNGRNTSSGTTTPPANRPSTGTTTTPSTPPRQ
jgi:sporulation protein YlmC with PRC-barrel domain